MVESRIAVRNRVQVDSTTTSRAGEDHSGHIQKELSTMPGEIFEAKKILCLNDQGGANISISTGKTATLRAQDHGHPPIVIDERKKTKQKDH